MSAGNGNLIELQVEVPISALVKYECKYGTTK